MGNEPNDKASYEALLKKYLNYQCTESELKIVFSLLTDNEHKDILPELLHRASLKFHSEFKMKEDHGKALWNQVSNEIYAMDRIGSRRKLVFSASRIAASVMLVLGIAFFAQIYFFAESEVAYITKTTDRGQRLTFTLGDGSTVKLNSESTITFPKEFDENKREIQLSGEAFFEIKRDPRRPFTVAAGDVRTTVLGTSFNVSAFPDKDIVVTVSTGKVHVSAERSASSQGKFLDNQYVSEIVLTTGQQAIYHVSDENLTSREVSLDHYVGWKDGILTFEETPLGEVAEILQRWYDVEIQFNDDRLMSCAVTSTFKSETIDDVLEELKFIFKLSYTVDNQKIAVSGKGCE